jgi:hypothetical protein
LVAYGLVNLVWGGWAYADPAGFFDDFPGFGRRWTGAYPPYNEHLVTDLGATFLTLGVLLVLAGWWDDRRVVIVVLVGDLVFNTLHLGYHAFHQGEMAGADYAASLVSLAFGVLVPIILFVLNGRRRS